MSKDKWINRIHQGDVLEILKQMPDEFVDMVITSPPYWGLRNYDVDGQIGLEEHPQLYINKLVDISNEIKRVLKKSGSFYLNLGDTYCGSGGAGGDYNVGGIREGQPKYRQPTVWKDPKLPARGRSSELSGFKPEKTGWLQAKQLMLIPSRVAIALQNDGWILRNDNIWHKNNPLPSSVKDRLNNTFEHVFHFVKNRRYYYDLDAIRVPHKIHENRPYGIVRNRLYKYDSKLNKIRGLKSNDIIEENMKVEAKKRGYSNHSASRTVTHLHQVGNEYSKSDLGKNRGDVFDIPTHPFPGAHFAVFPKSLVKIPIKAACPEWVCKKCGKPRERILEKTERVQQHWAPGTDKKTEQAKGKHGSTSTLVTGYKFNYKTVGWSDCGCNANFEPGIVLDPFAGSGTACLVAKQMGRRYIGLELNPEYVKMARKRLAKSASVHNWLDEADTSSDKEGWKWSI